MSFMSFMFLCLLIFNLIGFIVLASSDDNEFKQRLYCKYYIRKFKNIKIKKAFDNFLCCNVVGGHLKIRYHKGIDLRACILGSLCAVESLDGSKYILRKGDVEDVLNEFHQINEPKELNESVKNVSYRDNFRVNIESINNRIDELDLIVKNNYTSAIRNGLISKKY